MEVRVPKNLTVIERASQVSKNGRQNFLVSCELGSRVSFFLQSEIPFLVLYLAILDFILQVVEVA